VEEFGKQTAIETSGGRPSKDEAEALRKPIKN